MRRTTAAGSKHFHHMDGADYPPRARVPLDILVAAVSAAKAVGDEAGYGGIELTAPDVKGRIPSLPFVPP